MAAGGPPWGAGASVPHLVPLACCFSAQIVSGEVVVVVDEPMLMVRLGWLLGPLGIGSKVGVVGTVVMVGCGRHAWWRGLVASVPRVVVVIVDGSSLGFSLEDGCLRTCPSSLVVRMVAWKPVLSVIFFRE